MVVVGVGEPLPKVIKESLILGQGNFGHLYYHGLKGFTCLHTSRPKKTETEVCNQQNKGLFKKLAPSLETQVS